MRALALDVGSKTIGVAMTDEARIAAHPFKVLSRVGNSGDARAVAAVVAEHAVSDVVVGMPFELSGKLGHRARRVRAFIAALREVLPTGAHLHEQDERFTTAEAERALIAADVPRAHRRSVIDGHAAALILRAWLDAQPPRG
ncbi:MAG: Holliday junction resolvase RuvX [Deltaproteobacteria bacterium]|nr:MAG: Holliday junction resolvase RuvX [Deltaproteobacteria bacterium]TMQ19120.1 MAG: Holliday junction resolvase RuvX [Deltaproteobacteria bacterium]